MIYFIDICEYIYNDQKKKNRSTNNDLQNTTQKRTRRVIAVTNPVINDERTELTTNGTYSWSFLTQIVKF
jgi:hypothetical protein